MQINNKSLKLFGFTLAEILITIGIIGVVAAITIPILLNNIQNYQYKVAYKKSYSVLSQALNNANADNAMEAPSGSSDIAHLNNFKTLMSYIKTQKTCYDQTDNSECWYKDGEEYNSSSYSNGFPKLQDLAVIDISGMSWATYGSGYDSSIFVDTNGLKGPNQFGKDRFQFRPVITAANYLSNWNSDGRYSGLCTVIMPDWDNDVYACKYNKCGTTTDPDYNTFYATSWLYGKN